MKLTTERIREAFKEYNSQFFNGELTPDFEIGFMKTIRSLGRVTSSRSRHENKVLKFTLSLEFEWNEDTFAKVVLHEMVHVWQTQINPKSRGHDRIFARKIREISTLSGIDVPFIEINGKSTSKRDVKYIYVENKNDYSIVFCNQKNHAAFLEYWIEKTKNKNTKIFTGNAVIGSNYSIFRKCTRYYRVKTLTGDFELNTKEEVDITKNLSKEASESKKSYFLYFKSNSVYKIIFCSKSKFEEFLNRWRLMAFDSSESIHWGLCEKPAGMSSSRISSRYYRIRENELKSIVILEKFEEGINSKEESILNNFMIIPGIHCVRTNNGAYIIKGNNLKTLEKGDILVDLKSRIYLFEKSLNDFIDSMPLDSLIKIFPQLTQFDLEDKSVLNRSRVDLKIDSQCMSIGITLRSEEDYLGNLSMEKDLF